MAKEAQRYYWCESGDGWLRDTASLVLEATGAEIDWSDCDDVDSIPEMKSMKRTLKQLIEGWFEELTLFGESRGVLPYGVKWYRDADRDDGPVRFYFH